MAGLDVETLELLGLVALLAGAVNSLVLLLLLKVFQPGPLAMAPARRGAVSLLVAGGVVFFYIGAGIFVGQVLLVTKIIPPDGAGKSAGESVLFQGIDALIKFPICAGIALLMARLMSGGLRAWGLGLRQIPRGIGYGIGAFAAIYPLLILLNIGVEFLLEQFGRGIVEHETFDLLKQNLSGGKVAVLLAAAAVAAPIFEEMFFRGILQTALIQPWWGLWTGKLPTGGKGFEVEGVTYGSSSSAGPVDFRATPARRWAAILITAFLFALIHFSPTNFPVLFALGVALGYTYERTGNLWASITLHALFNGVNLGQFFLYGG